MALQGKIRIDDKSHAVRGEDIELELTVDESAERGGGGLQGTTVSESFSMKDGILVTSSKETRPDGSSTTTTRTSNTNDGSSTTTTTTTDSGGNTTTTIEITTK